MNTTRLPALRAGSSVAVLLFAMACGGPADDPWPGVPLRPAATPHDTLVRGSFGTRAEAVGGCLECHAGEPDELQGSAHAGVAVDLPPRAGPGHADAPVDPGRPADCLACHAEPDLLTGGGPLSAQILENAARGVRRPTPENCLSCHNVGGPSTQRGVHLDKHALGCTDCHRTAEHRMPGSGGGTASGTVSCTQCHATAPHPDGSLDRHVGSVACTTCHVPRARVAADYGWYRGQDGTASVLDDPDARIWPVDSTGPLVHEIPDAAEAFTCGDCHTRYGVLDWEGLGYPGDPASEGGRALPDRDGG